MANAELRFAEQPVNLEFAETFGALTAPDGLTREPFRWQVRLFEAMTSGLIPSALDLPTGLGKTSVMAVWLLALASGAPLPRRLVYIVDRRAVVDQASSEAVRIAERATAVQSIAAALGLSTPLAVSTLRGQHVDNRAWTRDPAAPAIIVGTVDMVGSRLLFEGYGVSRRMRPMHAGLLGTDALMLLDEAHLVPPFARLLDDAAALAESARQAPRPALRVMALSATLGAANTAPFRLADADMEDPPVRRRLHAAKSLERREITGNLAEAIAATVGGLIAAATRPVRVIAFCDRRTTAEAVAALLAKAKTHTLMLVGGRRVRERALDARALQDAGFLAGSGAAEVSTVLVATSAGEVGVDLDADHMVCDLVAWERMVQRLGRVNRRGEGSAQVVVVDDLDPKAVPLAEGADREAVRGLLDGLPVVDGAGRDASPLALTHVDPELAARGRSVAPLRPALTTALLEAWSLTGLEDHPGRPEPAPWLRGWVEDEEPQVTLVWRSYLPWRDPLPSLQELVRFFEYAPPHLSETLETERSRALDWLRRRVGSRGRAVREAGRAEEVDRLAAVTLASDGAAEAAWTLRQLEAIFAKGAGPRARETFERTLTGARLVVDAALGGLREGLLAADEDTPPATADGDTATWGEDQGADPGFRIMVRDASEPAAPESAWTWVTRVDGDGAPQGNVFDLVATTERTGRGEAGSKARRPVTLASHRDRVAAKAADFAARLGLPPDEAQALVLAARLHDEGKAAAVWQMAMGAPSAGGPFAKTTGGDGRRLNGYRHEFGSLMRALVHPEIAALPPQARELVLHLIAAHHGHARPGIAVDGGEGAPSALAGEAAQAALRFARLTRLYGPWGLAWREALLRAADHAASAEEDGDG